MINWIKKHSIKILLGSITVGFLIIHFIGPIIITEIRHPAIEFLRGKHLTTLNFYYDGSTENGREIKVKSFDGTEIVAYETYSKKENIKGTIVLLHGIRSDKEQFLELSDLFAGEGYNAVAMDLRAHGASGGQYCTFGVKEKQDVTAIIDYLEFESKSDLKVIVFGQSLGGAVGLQSMAYDNRIQCGIIESTFSDFRSITHDYFDFHAGFAIKPLSNYLVYRAGKVADFDPDHASLFESCKKITQPVFMVHGAEDQRISIDYGQRNFSNLQNENSKFLKINEANHSNVWQKAPNDYFEMILEFIDANSK